MEFDRQLIQLTYLNSVLYLCYIATGVIWIYVGTLAKSNLPTVLNRFHHKL